MRAAVVVVGDLGRSPRMQYHAHALADSGVDVDLVGYKGAPLPKFLTEHPRVAVHRLDEARWRYQASRRSKIVYGVLAVVDALRASLRLLGALMRIPRPDLLLVQTPPSLPTLAGRLAGVAPSRRARSCSTGTISATRSWRSGSGGGIPPCGWLDGSSSTPGGARTRTCACPAGSRVSSQTVSRSRDVRVLYDRPASAFVPDRAHRARADPSGPVRRGWRSAGPAPSASSSARRAGPRTKTSTSSSRPSCGSRIASAAGRPAMRSRRFHGSRHPGDRRRQAPRRVRTAVRRACRRGAYSCALAGSSPKTIRGSSAAPTSGCACTVPRRGSISR